MQERGRDKTKRLKRESLAKRYKRSARGSARVRLQFEACGRYIGKPATVDTVKVSTSGHAAKDILRKRTIAKLVMK